MQASQASACLQTVNLKTCNLGSASNKACGNCLYQDRPPINGSDASCVWQLRSVHQTEAPETGDSLQLSRWGLSRKPQSTHKRKRFREVFPFFSKGTQLVGHRAGDSPVLPDPQTQALVFCCTPTSTEGYLQGCHQVQGDLFPQSLQGSPEEMRGKKYGG